jgi:MFS family permease
MTLSPQSAPSAWRLIRFAAIAVPIYAAAQPVVAYLPAIMAKDFGLSLGTLGLLMLAGQIINSVLDPVIGTLSDHTRARFGRRRTWIAAGGLTFTAGAVLLFFRRPAAASSGSQPACSCSTPAHPPYRRHCSPGRANSAAIIISARGSPPTSPCWSRWRWW